MSRDHQSFLKMIGLEDDAHGSFQSPTTTEGSGPTSQTQSETEWELNQELAETRESVESHEPMESIEAPTYEEVPPLEEPIEERPPDQTFTYSAEERAFLEQDIAPENRGPEMDASEATERANPLLPTGFDEASSELPQETIERTMNLEPHELSRSIQAGTRPTVAFEYEAEEPAQKTDGTAHFDYSKEQGVSRLVILVGEANSNAIHLGKFPIRIGRNFSNELILNDSNVSRFHAEIVEHEGAIIIKDSGSTNGVKVNGALVRDHALQPHDVIQVGDALMEFLPPGVLSRGIPQASVIPADMVENLKEVSRVVTGAVKRGRSKLYLILGFLGVAAFAMTGPLKELMHQKTMEVATHQVLAQVDDLRTSIERQHGKPIAELEGETVAKAVLSAVEESAFGELVPESAKEQITKVDPEVLKIFLQDSEATAGLAFEATDEKGLRAVLTTKISRLIDERKFKEALTIVDMILKWNPNDTAAQEVAKKLRMNLDASTPAPDSLTPEDEKIFKEHIARHNKSYLSMVEQGRFDDAIQFSEAVSKALIDIVEKNPVTEPLVDTEIRRWADRAEELRRRIEEDAEIVVKANKDDEDVARRIESIKVSMDIADAKRARNEINEFLRKYPKHRRTNEVVQLNGELTRALEAAFETARTNIERFVDTEAFANAWQEFYRLSDNMPTHPRLNALREALEKSTGNRAVQFYNQARVYEFETDDLVAAEQYYKRSMEVADPRSELSRKAERRYAEVKRKVLP